MSGGSGDDKLYGEGGNDGVYGGDCNDDLNGGAGNDFLNGGDGNDTPRARSSTNKNYGAIGDDTISSGTGVDIFSAGQ